jgi:hypothetical protein
MMSRPLTLSVAPPAAPSLAKEFQSTTPAIVSALSHRFDPINGTIYTHTGCQDAHDLLAN